jgi:2,3,4,5-tetrahydropyridine-2-carboxylate N-succinyltransferase
MTLARTIDEAWEVRDTLSPDTKGALREAVDSALADLDSGRLRVAEKIGGEWHVHQWLKKAVLLSFRLNAMKLIDGAPGDASWWDKVDSKFAGWGEKEFQSAGFRAVPGAIVRKSAFIAKSVVLMPSFVNVGAYVDEGTMVDTWATVGSCAQSASIVTFPAAPASAVCSNRSGGATIIEDNCFIGVRSEVAEGVIVGEGSVISMGVFIGQSTKIVDRHTGEIFQGRVPPYSVVVPGSLGGGPGKPALYCAVIIKRVDERTRAKTSINELLRD